jgi:hypothetical protein
MAKSSKVWFSFLLVLTNCGEGGDARLRQAASEPPGESVPASPFRAETCNGSVLVVKGTECRTSTPGWTARRLFPAELARVDRLVPYCVYEWTGDGDPVGRPYGRPVAPEERDCLAVSGQAPAPGIAAGALEQRFLEHAAALDELPVPTNPGAQPVRVAVIDSARDLAVGDVGGGNSSHGRAVGLVISRLACPPAAGSACLAEIDNILALRVMRTPTGLTRDPNGGFFGFQSDVAGAIFEAVASNPPNRRLIINLSLGWHQAFGDLVSPRLSVEAVYEALRYARCRGALVIAASGNSSGALPPSDGPLLPADWQRLATPDNLQCQADFGLGGALSGPGPLLYAVSGVDDRDQFLFNTPIGARAPLAAPALQVIISDPNRPPNVPAAFARTGSSMAAALVSAGAAVAWAYNPLQRSSDVMATLEGTGIDLGVPADYCLGAGVCPNVHRVSICAAVAAACQAGFCAFSDPKFSCPTDGPRSPAGSSLDLSRAPAEKCDASRSINGCAPNPLQAFQNTLLMPLATPQPDEPECPPCDADRVFSYFYSRLAAPAPSVLRIELSLNPRLPQQNISPDGLWLYDDAGLVWVSLWDRPPLLKDGGNLTWEIDAAEEGLVGELRAGQIDFIYERDGRTGNPITQLKGEPLSVR